MNKQELGDALEEALEEAWEWRKSQCIKHDLEPNPDEYAEEEINRLTNVEFMEEIIQNLRGYC